MNSEKPLTEKAKSQSAKKRKCALIFSGLFLLIANLLFFVLLWFAGTYEEVLLDQLLYQLKSSVVGTSSDLSASGVWSIVGVGTLLTLGEIIIWLLISGNLTKFLRRFSLYIRYSATRVAAFFKKAVLPISTAALVLSLLFFVLRLNVIGYVINTTEDSDFIEENYVDPENATLIFPEEKRNLIYIFVESMENTFSDTAAGGKITDNFIKPLTDLREENISFSNTDGINGGALSFMGTTWTAASLVSQTAGITLKVPFDAEYYGGENGYLSGAYSIGDILERAGYNQVVLFGSDARFAGRDVYFTEHGNYEILDTVSLKESGRLPKDYSEWWGFEDEKLFDYAKEELLRLANEEEPFNLTMLTADSHFPNGYLCDDCPAIYEEQYPNVLTCSAERICDFIDWIKEQDFYENTTIVISGDHLTMDAEFLDTVDPSYTRTIYNCFINSAVTPTNTTKRQFGVFDMLPSTLAAMGVEIEGNRLALGTNLFSNEKTLTEIYGFEFLDDEFLKDSEYYEENIMNDD